MGPFTAIAGGLSPVLRKLPKLDLCVRRRGFAPSPSFRGRVGVDRRLPRGWRRCLSLLRSCRRRTVTSRSASMARALRRDASPGRLRTHFPSGPSSRPVPGVQVDARCPVGGSRTLNFPFPLRGFAGSRLLSGPRPYCPFLPGTEEIQRVIPYTWRAGFFSSDVPRETYLRPTVSGARGEELRVLETGAAASIRTSSAPSPAGPTGSRAKVRSASLLGAALLCRPPPRVSDVHRQPTRPVLKHGPRSPGRSRVVGAPLTNPGGVAKARERVGGHRFRRGVPAKSSARSAGLGGSPPFPRASAASEPSPIPPARRVSTCPYFPSSAPRPLSSPSSSDFPIRGR